MRSRGEARTRSSALRVARSDERISEEVAHRAGEVRVGEGVVNACGDHLREKQEALLQRGALKLNLLTDRFLNSH